ncbi:MAG: hypothetical protein KKA05_01855 [Alphaproteobacteria bacterium]|nr:hypothetical protein [Alphaproteobacteria bacterium]MBU0859933.1 hypothetical protein [Alphaproteobacteria bacterium]
MNNPLHRQNESGNVIVFILMAVVLIGIVTAAIRSGGGERQNIDSEQLIIRAAEVRQYGSELERAVGFLLQNGVSEYDIRFAHTNASSDYGDINTNPETQVFARQGGGAQYRVPALGLQTAQSNWNFYGNSALPRVGSSRSDLVAVLPNVTPEFCAAINKGNGYAPSIIPIDPDPGCIETGDTSYFNDDDGTADTADDYGATNVIPIGTSPNEFLVPAIQGCLRCGDNSLHFFHVLIAR